MRRAGVCASCVEDGGSSVRVHAAVLCMPHQFGHDCMRCIVVRCGPARGLLRQGASGSRVRLTERSLNILARYLHMHSRVCHRHAF